MALRRELILSLGALVALNVLLAFGAIGLFVRMGPAIERILQENVHSLIAAENVLAEIAVAGGGPATAAGRANVDAALRRAEQNVTEAGEVTILRTIETNVDAALDGDPVARLAVVRSLEALMKLNRAAMQAVDRDAKRLGSAGAWAASFVGVASFALSLLVLARLRRRVIQPLAELHAVLQAAREGDRHRRCRPCAAPAELIQVRAVVNALLDERLSGPLDSDARSLATPG